VKLGDERVLKRARRVAFENGAHLELEKAGLFGQQSLFEKLEAEQVAFAFGEFFGFRDVRLSFIDESLKTRKSEESHVGARVMEKLPSFTWKGWQGRSPVTQPIRARARSHRDMAARAEFIVEEEPSRNENAQVGELHDPR